MVAIPAWCPNCNKMVDGSAGIHVEGTVTGLTLNGNEITCPECRGRARVIEGTFNVTEGIIEVVTASPWTRYQLAKYQSALRWAAENYAERPRAAIRRIEKVSPETATYIRRLRDGPYTRSDIIALLSLMATVVFGILQFVTSDEKPVQVTNEQVIQIINETKGSGTAAPDPPPPKLEKRTGGTARAETSPEVPGDESPQAPRE